MADGTPGFRDEAERPEGGDAACWAHLVCPECGAMLDDPGHPPAGLSPSPCRS